MCISSSSLPQPPAHFSDGTRLVLCSGPSPEPRRAECALLKTCNQLYHNRRVFHSSLRDGTEHQRENAPWSGVTGDCAASWPNIIIPNLLGCTQDTLMCTILVWNIANRVV